MRVARWKVMAGGLLLSAGGLMAVADGPPAVPMPGCQPAPVCLPAVPAPTTPAPTITRVSLDAPIPVPAPNVAELPAAVPSVPPLTLPPAPAATRVEAKPGTTVTPWTPPPVSATTVLTDPKAGRTTTKRAFAKLDNGRTVEVEAGVPKLPEPHATVHPDPKPAVPPPPSPVPALPPSAPVVPSPAFAPVPFVNTLNAEPAVPAAAPAPAVPADRPPPEPKKPEPSLAEKRLKVVLHMGDDRPRFEVRDGDEIYLKVVSDRVEVKSAADKGDAPTMKAGGKVAFVTPGGDGTCDELTILPGSGQVVAAGTVTFRHTWGRSETTVSGDRMTFRLAHPGPTAIQAGYTPVK